MICARCGADIYKFSTCNYCKRNICSNCIQSSRRISKVIRLVICADCWSKMGSRKLFKSATKDN